MFTDGQDSQFSRPLNIDSGRQDSMNLDMEGLTCPWTALGTGHIGWACDEINRMCPRQTNPLYQLVYPETALHRRLVINYVTVKL